MLFDAGVDVKSAQRFLGHEDIEVTLSIYTHLTIDDVFGTLSSIMHGYISGCVDVVPIYKKLFGYDFGGAEVISVNDVLCLDYDELSIIDEQRW